MNMILFSLKKWLLYFSHTVLMNSLLLNYQQKNRILRKKKEFSILHDKEEQKKVYFYIFLFLKIVLIIF